MTDIAKQVINFYIQNGRKPKVSEIELKDAQLLDEQGCVFVTLYHKGEVRGSAGNIKEIEANIVQEIIENTIKAISGDARFSPISPKEGTEAKIRVDRIIHRDLLKDQHLQNIDPATSGVIAIKGDYSRMAAILPNINPKLLNGQDFIPVLKNKLKDPEFQEKNYIIYEMKTKMETSF